MEYFCKDSDLKLQEWISSAKVGDYFEHRLGVVVRINPEC